MKRWRWLLALLVVSFLRPAWATAQMPATLPPDAFGILSPAPQGGGVGAPFEVPAAAPCKTWCLDFLLGFPTGLRAQVPIRGDERTAWLAEGFVGIEFIFPMVGGGLRRRFAAAFGKYDAFTFSPGLDAYFVYNSLHDAGGWFGGGPDGFGLITADLDATWRHGFTTHFEGELGIKLGVGGVFGGDKAGVVPVVSIFGGCRF